MAMNASFLRASLFTSIVAYGVAAMAIAMGVVFILIGLGIRDVERHLERLGLLVDGREVAEVPVAAIPPPTPETTDVDRPIEP